MTGREVIVRATRAGAYLLFAASGLAVLVWPPLSYSGAATWLTVAWGILLLGPGVAAAIGVLARRYVWEWVSAWWVAAGLAIYACLSWATVAESLGNAPRALILTGITLSVIARAGHMAAEDKRARLAVLARQEVTGE